MKSLLNYIIERQSAISLKEILNKSLAEEQKWKEIMKLDFEDLGILTKGKNDLKLDMRLDGFRNYDYSNHKPCVYFRVGSGEYDFLPMIISDNPYIPYSFEQTITDDELLWVYSWVKSNHIALLKFANEKIGYRSLFAKINENINFENDNIEEGKAKIVKEITGLTRVVWIGPYDGTGHYLRIKIQTPKSSNNTNEWASLSIPDLKLTGKHDLKQKELKGISNFALSNQETLDKFAKDEIDLDDMLDELIKVDKKGNPIQPSGNNENNTTDNAPE